MYYYRELHPFTKNDWVIIGNHETLAKKLRGSLVDYWTKKEWPQGFSSYPVLVYTLILVGGQVIQIQCDGTEDLNMEMNMVQAIIAPLSIRQDRRPAIN